MGWGTGDREQACRGLCRPVTKACSGISSQPGKGCEQGMMDQTGHSGGAGPERVWAFPPVGLLLLRL